MSLEQKALALAQAVGTDIRALIATVGDLSALTTIDKTNLVSAINEQVTALSQIDLSALINDAGTAISSTWSSNKISAELLALKQQILNGAPEAYNTLQEIAAALAANDAELSNLLTDLGGTVRYDAAQALVAEEQLQACTNIGVSNYDVDLLALYGTSKGIVVPPETDGPSSPEADGGDFNFTASTINNGSSGEVTGGNFAF